jgi:hypothetical protein
LLFLNGGDLLTHGFVSSLATQAGVSGADITISQTAIRRPELQGGQTQFYRAENYEFLSEECFADFMQNAPSFWGWYFVGNKLISRDLWEKAVPALEKFLSSKGARSIYGEDMIFSTALWKSARKAVHVAGEFVIFNWGNEDEYLKQAMEIPTEILKDIRHSLNFVQEAVGKNKADFFPIRDAFVRRFWWRAEWILDRNKSQRIEDEMKELFDIDSLERTAAECAIEDNLYDLELTKEDLFGEDGDYITDKKVRIYVSMHKLSYVPQNNNFIVPIQVGAAIADERFDGMAHDDEGENISEKNKRYCELTAQYWAWKNDTDADYYGFWHYRRYFSFNESENENENVWGVLPCDLLNEKSLKQYCIDELHISQATENYDIIVPSEWECFEDGKLMTVYEHWCKHFKKEDLDLSIKIVGTKYPEYYHSLLDVVYSNSAFFCNMFIMKKELFDEYSAFVFDVLDEIEQKAEHRRYNTEEYHVLGHISERLLSAYVKYIEDERPEISVLYLSRTQFSCTRPLARLKALDKENRIAIALACDNGYMLYTDVLLQSILENENSAYFYDIVIMHRDISEYNQRISKDIFSGRNNFSLRFLDVTRNFEAYENVHIDRHLTFETYYRFLVPDLFNGYEKVLYMDCDMIVNADISELFSIDLTGKYIGAVHDFDFIANAVAQEKFYWNNALKYLKLNDYFDYFQAGVMLLNIPEIQTDFSSESLFQTALSRSWYFHDQDVLNYLFKGKVHYINCKWNVFSLLEKGSDREILIKN